MSDLATRSERGQLAASPIDRFTLLDHYAGGRVAPRAQQPTLATISAGYRQKGAQGELGRPVVSRDGTIYVNGQENLAQAFEVVPGLASALQAGKRKRLTIAFPFDQPELFLQQRFACYSATALQLYGDEHSLTSIRMEGEGKAARPVHTTVLAGTDDYEAGLRLCKTNTSLYFLLAEWGEDGPRVVFPDGAGLYRLRMTSRNSAQSIVNSLRWIARLTGGRIAGVPFDLYLDQQDVVAPDGKRRRLPIWQLVLKPPKRLELTTANFQQVLGGAIEQGERLKVLPPPAESAEYAALEGPDVDLDDPEPGPTNELARQQELTPAQVKAALRGGLCNPGEMRRIFFGRFGGGPLGQPGPRAEFIAAWTQGRSDSLAEFLEDATPSEAQAMLRGAEDWTARNRAQVPANLVALSDDPSRMEPGDDDELEPGDGFPVDDAAAWTEDGPFDGGPSEPDASVSEPSDEGEKPEQDESEQIRRDDIFTTHRERCVGLEQAKTSAQLELAWGDVARDSNYLGEDSVRILTGIYEGRKKQLGGRR